jgi:ATP-dependent exoDNAse (exonuclease V) beta subunit
MLAKRDQWERHVGGDDGAGEVPTLAAPLRGSAERGAPPPCGAPKLREQFEAVLRRVVRDGLRRVSSSVPEEHRGELIRLLRTAEANLVAEGKPNPLEILRGITALPGCEGEDIDKWCAVAWFLLTGGKWRSRMNINNGFPTSAKDDKRRCEELLILLREQEIHHPDFRPALVALADLPATAFADSQWQVLEALLKVLPIAVAELKKLFQENAATDFIEVAQGAFRAVDSSGGMPSTGKIRHLLVDEFQDTSVMQWRLLSALVADWKPGDGHTLFLVGDPMQSIYRFRQAEVGLFIQAKEKGFGKLQPKSLALKVNFRSDKDLVEWFNDRFQSVFGTRDDSAQGRVSFNDCVAGPGKELGSSPQVHWSTSAEDEAQQLLEVVRERITHGGEVAILVRARTHLPEILTQLRSAGIAFEAVEIQKLGERAVIQDLLMLTRALLHPADRLAWIAMLRAPWCGLALADLHALCGHDLHSAIWDCLNGDTSALSDDGRKRIERVREMLSSALQTRRRKPLREWVEGAWIALGGSACVIDAADMDNAEAFFELLEGLEAAGDIVNLDDLGARVDGLFAKAEAGSDVRVKVMTIHKAKGLEFDTVIVPGLGRGAQKDRARLLLWEERAGADGPELLLAPITQKGADEKDPIYRYLQKAEAARRVEEEKRLLYVAVTRAKHELHLVATPRLKENGDLRQDGSLLRFLWPDLRNEYEARSLPEDESTVVALAASEGEERKPRMIRRLPANWRLQSLPDPMKWTGDDITTAAGRSEHITYDWVSEKLRHIGTVVHAMVQRIARDGLKCWPSERISQSRAIYRAALAERGLGPKDADDAAMQVEQALLSLTSDERGRWTLAPHEDAQSEYALSGVLESGRVEHFKLDRTFVDDQGTRWIIDYKTARHEGSGLDAFLDSEQARHKQQLDNYARVLKQMEPSRPIRVGLYFPLLGGWREWKADN